jgi:hypothetical protein
VRVQKGNVATLDFNELDGDPPGERFEALVRLIGERLGLVVQWSGRGADAGRDMIFIENQQGPLRMRPVRWLVSCKDNSQSNKSVSEKDIGSILDKVQQHRCDGFLLATTTTASTGLKEKLDKLDISMSGPIQTKVWDRFEITKMLLSDQCADLLLQFFPKQKARESLQHLDAAREVIEASLPRFVVGFVRKHLVPYSDRLSLLSGKNVWPHDADQMSLIDDLKQDATQRWSIDRAAKKLQGLHFDAFVAFMDQLIRNFPEQATQLLQAVARISSDGGVIYNAIDMLRETEDFILGDEIEITRKCDPDTLFELYRDLAHDILEDKSVWDWRLPNDVQRHADKVELSRVRIEDLEFEGGDAVCLRARLTLRAYGSSFDPAEPSVGERDFSYDIEAHLEADGIEIDTVN